MASKNYLIVLYTVILSCFFTSCMKDEPDDLVKENEEIEEDELAGKNSCLLTKIESYKDGVLLDVLEYKYNTIDLVEHIIFKYYSNGNTLSGVASIEFDDKKRVKKIITDSKNFIDEVV